MKQFRCKYFTLLELTAVIVILLLLTAVSGVYIGRERKMPAFERALRDFQVFCAKARAESMRDGAVRKVVFYPAENVFRIEKADSWGISDAIVLADEVEEGNMPYVVLDAIDPEWEAEEEAKYAGVLQLPDHQIHEWRFPEKLGVQFELPGLSGVEINEDNLELWRYQRNGSARITYALTVQMGSDMRTMSVSDFTGLVEIGKADENEGSILL